MSDDERYKITYERDMWGWIPSVYDQRNFVLVLFTVWPSLTLDRARRRVAKKIARYERGETYRSLEA